MHADRSWRLPVQRHLAPDARQPLETEAAVDTFAADQEDSILTSSSAIDVQGTEGMIVIVPPEQQGVIGASKLIRGRSHSITDDSCDADC